MTRLTVLAVPMVAALLGGLVGGCVSMTPPARFLVVEEGFDSWKATTPEDSKLWVREFDDDDKGELAFWKDALKKDLVDNRGYLVVFEGEIKDGDGRAGAELVLESTIGGQVMRELVAVFALPGWCGNTIRVVEFVAERERFDKEVAGVRSAIATLH